MYFRETEDLEVYLEREALPGHKVYLVTKDQRALLDPLDHP